MSLVVFEHDPVSNSGRLGKACRDLGHRLVVRNMVKGDCVPVDLDDVDGLVIMGGPMSVHEQDKYPWLKDEVAYIRAAHEARLPVVGVCLGAQLISLALGGDVEKMPAGEVGWHEVTLGFPGTTDAIYGGIPWKTLQYHSHEWFASRLPADSTPLASSKLCKHQAFRVGLRTYAFQYHFEWNADELRYFSQGRLFEELEKSGRNIEQEISRNYDSYARLGERLCNNIAMLLFPIDKR